MMEMDQLREIATKKVNPQKLSKDCYIGSVACVLMTDKGNMYTGVCIDAPSGIGFCAEHAAIASMVNNDETRIVKIVAVGKNGKIYPPCGRCREFIYQINAKNIDAEILVEENKIVKLAEILPSRWN
ncbi:MAG: cytidine deaminase family protein [Anaerobacillus sp.]|uniref:cytidine deaminase family protein n=1 Tax=Anaerobacillus sp. TaxID=1872506 RepID=UPI0039191207